MDGYGYGLLVLVLVVVSWFGANGWLRQKRDEIESKLERKESKIESVYPTIGGQKQSTRKAMQRRKRRVGDDGFNDTTFQIVSSKSLGFLNQLLNRIFPFTQFCRSCFVVISMSENPFT